MSKKPSKIKEPKAAYIVSPTAKTPAKAARDTEAKGIRYADDAEFRKISDKIFRVHGEVLRKLAQ